MHLNLIEFFTEWILRSLSRTDAFTAYQSNPAINLSPAMYYMQASGLHARTASYYHSPTDESYDSRVLASQAGMFQENGRMPEDGTLIANRSLPSNLFHALP